MKSKLFRILTITLFFFFLTGFVPILSFVGPGVTVLTSGNVYKALYTLPEVRTVTPGPTNERIGTKPVKKKKNSVIVKILNNLDFIVEH